MKILRWRGRPGKPPRRRRRRCFTFRAREPLAIVPQTTKPKVFFRFLLGVVLMGAEKAPPPRRRGASIPLDHSAVRRDQISVKLSSPSPFTSEA
jgi:hypothetical protein